MSKLDVALVTGGSGSIGQSITNYLLKENWVVFSTYHDHPERLPRECIEIQTDFTNPEKSSRHLLDRFQSEPYDSLDLLIHAAGATVDSLFMSLSHKEWNRVRKINLDSLYYLASNFENPLQKNSLEKNQSSHFVIITSLSALKGRKGQTNYASSKSGSIGFMLSLAREWTPEVLVNAIRPPLTESNMTSKIPERETKKLLKNSLRNSISSPQATVDSLRYLLQSEFITGQIISSDNRINNNWT